MGLVAGILWLATAAVQAQKKSIQLPADNPASVLKPGEGQALTTTNCALCHSVDYIIRQPRMAAAQWEAEVRKMITVYGAPINDVNAKAISEYLARNYSSQAAASSRPPATEAK
jgi:mono/diheme cytochrome c family protein